jgi:hypothetical protein
MKKWLTVGLPLIGCSMLGCSMAVNATGFTVDRTIDEVNTTLKVATIAGLDNQQHSWLAADKLQVCVDDAQLKMPVNLELMATPSKSDYSFEVYKGAQAVVLTFAIADKQPTYEFFKSLTQMVATAPSCDGYRNSATPLISIANFLGTNSLSSLLTMADKYQPVYDLKSVRPVVNQPNSSQSPWFVTTSLSEDAVHQAVTLRKPDVTQHQLLVLTCTNKVADLSIAANDFLGDESKNIVLKFDGHRAQQLELELSENNRSLRFSSPEQQLAIMTTAHAMIVRYTNFNGVVKTLTFKLDDFADKIQPYRLACGL